MKKHQIGLLFATVASAALLCQSANATAILTEQFQNYTTGQLGSTAGNGGTGLVPGWNAPRNDITVTNGSGSLDGTGLGLVISAGDMVHVASDTPDTNAAGIPNGAYNKFVNSGTFPPTVTNNLYCSFLYQFNVGTDVPPDGAMIAGMYLQSGGIQSASGADAYWQVYARNVGGNIQLGIAKNIYLTTPVGYTPGVTNWASTNISVGQTVFVVVRLQINATNFAGFTTATNGVDVIDDLWINPPHNSFGTNEANVPTPSVSSPIGDGAVPTSGTGPGRFFIVDDGPGANIDELRISTNWADVTPPLGQCLSATNALTTDISNITQSAEINATFTVGALNDTAPSFLWQISKDSGAHWSNIPGAVFPSYTTANLQLATDQGNQYRTIVSVACDNSSITSSVATVTLTAPVVTPPGTILFDDFHSGLRGNPPVTANNSVWYTAISADLSSYPSGPLVGITITNSSSMWLGYFVDESTTNLPVDLAISNEIVVTMPFIPNAYTDYSTNGPMRFGLFDYADGGTLITADSSLQPGSVTGSAGNGVGVRGYMVNVDFGTNFSTASPLSLYTRNGLGDIALMSTTGDYLQMGTGGPSGASYTNAPAFQVGTTYTLVLSVTRLATNVCSITASISGGGTNWTYSATDTSGLAYHRFDAFSFWNNKGVNSADSFNIPSFEVDVDNAVPLTSINITNITRSGNKVTLAWSPTPAGTYNYSIYRTNTLTSAWTTLQANWSATTYTDTNATGSVNFYRVSSP